MTNPFKILKGLGIDRAKLEEMAKSMAKDPDLRKAFDENIDDKDFEKSVDEFYDEIQDGFDHGDDS